MRRVYPNPEYCIGCHLCELACLTEHSKSKDIITAYTVERLQGLSPCKRVYHRGPESVALSCRHCEDAECVKSCISGALHKNPDTGRTEYDPDKCVGCWSCVMACTFGAIQRNPQKHKIIKCDLCAGRDIPACVQACPNRALICEEE